MPCHLASAQDLVEAANFAEIDKVGIVLDNNALGSISAIQLGTDEIAIEPTAIFAALGSQYKYNAQENLILVTRAQDQAHFTLNTQSGMVKVNKKPVGILKNFGTITDDGVMLTPNAVSVLTGTDFKYKKNQNIIEFKLDARLRTTTGFELFVNDIALGDLQQDPRSIGPVLLLPLEPIVNELGHKLTRLNDSEIMVERNQDSAEFTLNLDSGLLKLHGKPYGRIKDHIYIDKSTLLLPQDAIENLTGVHVSVNGQTGRIDIDLDDRLSGAIKPSSSVEDIIATTPFTPERLTFHLGPDTINTVYADFRVKGLNGRLRYEVPDLPMSSAELTPSWLSIDFAHVNGVKGSIGDYAANYRELDGINSRRIRGVSVQMETNHGRYAMAAGLAARGSTILSDDQSRLKFGPQVAGLRYADKAGWEVGAAVKNDTVANDQAAVLSAISGRLGRVKDKKLQWDLRADAGIFNGPQRLNMLDARFSAATRYRVNDDLDVDMFAQYEGTEFLRNNFENIERLSTTSQQKTTISPDAIPDTRIFGSDQASVSSSIRYSPNKNMGIFINPAASLKVRTSQSGIRNTTINDSISNSVSANLAGELKNSRVNVSATGSLYSIDYDKSLQNETGRALSLNAFRQTRIGTFRGTFTSAQINDEKTKYRMLASASARPINIPMPKQATFNVAPTASAIWSEEAATISGGLYANFNSGTIFGEKNQLDASFGLLNTYSDTSFDRQDKYLTLTFARQIKFGNNTAIGISYRNNLTGDARFGLVLDQRLNFNEKRKYKVPHKGKGILKGRAFIDKNNDGIKQDDEIPAIDTLIRLKGSRLALRTDNDGYYTIQNLPAGLYDIQVEGRSLPLGYSLSETAETSAAIKSDFITEVSLPIVQRGQVNGFIFVDTDGDGQVRKGESRPENQELVLYKAGEDEPLDTMTTTSFGQFAFDNLDPGDYVIQLRKGSGKFLTKDFEFSLSTESDMIQKLIIPVSKMQSS